MHKTNVLLLIFLTLLIFSISLKNDFVGDDEDLFKAVMINTAGVITTTLVDVKYFNSKI